MKGFEVAAPRGIPPAKAAGYVQGTLLLPDSDLFPTDPNFSCLNQGMWAQGDAYGHGGMAVTISLPPGNIASEYNSAITLATNAATLCGFTVFDQATALVETPEDQVPQAAQNMSLNYVLLGSGAQLVVAVSRATATQLVGAALNVPLYWDYVAQELLAAPGGAAIPVTLRALDFEGYSWVVVPGTGHWNPNGYTAVIEC